MSTENEKTLNDPSDSNITPDNELTSSDSTRSVSMSDEDDTGDGEEKPRPKLPFMLPEEPEMPPVEPN